MRSRFSTGQFFLILSFLTVLGTGYATYAGYLFFRGEFPRVVILKTQYPVVQYMGPKKPFEVKFQKSRPAAWADLGQVSKAAVGAIIVSEDWAFYSHEGYDAAQIKEAIHKDWETGRFARGGSTITQQVAKNVFLERDKNLWRKLKELILAVELEEKVGKRRILEAYLNIAEWGEGIFGIRAAARHYFQKDPSELTAKEGAFLAMLLPSPKRYSQSYRQKNLTTYARKTIRNIINKMARARYLTEPERDLAQSTPLAFELNPVQEPAGSATVVDDEKIIDEVSEPGLTDADNPGQN